MGNKLIINGVKNYFDNVHWYFVMPIIDIVSHFIVKRIKRITIILKLGQDIPQHIWK